MTAVVRLKRHLDDEPLSALILNCKKRKQCENDETESEEVTTVLTFAGTINTPNDDITPHIKKEKLENSYKKHVPNITSKLRQQTRQTSENNRYKVVNLYRSIDKDVSNDEASGNDQELDLTIVDVESNTDAVANDETDYVYDLYFTNSEEAELDSELKICPANEVIFEDTTLSESEHDTDDSNDENNWRNDYPDEDELSDESSINDDDMRNAMDCLSLENDLLSSDDEPGGMDTETLGLDDDSDRNDCPHYGESFARFKFRQKKEEERYNRDEIDDSDEDYSA